MRRQFILLLGACLLAAGLVTAPAGASAETDAVEVRVLQLINQGRGGQGKGAEVMHAGLRGVARGHSADMSARNSMDHNGFPGRISAAAPDPAESNGAPDDGFNGSSCENVAWYQPGTSASTEQIAQKFYELWYNSPPHRDCMFDVWGRNLNAAGVGVYLSGGKWWATFDSAHDRTLPSGSTTTPTATPSPTSTSTPAPTATPAPTPTPTPTSTLLPPPLDWIRLQQNAPAVGYTGTWGTYATSYASGGSYRRSSTTGSAAKFAFTGAGVRWIGMSSPSGGIATVKLDGIVVASVNQYSSTTRYKRTMFERTGLSKSPHTLEVIVSGKRDSRARDKRAFVDAFDYYA